MTPALTAIATLASVFVIAMWYLTRSMAAPVVEMVGAFLPDGRIQRFFLKVAIHVPYLLVLGVIWVLWARLT